jgi:hypothetical protein
MTRLIAIILCCVVETGLAAAANANETPLRLLLSEVQPGAMATEQYCTLVFTDRRFHSEKATRKLGRDKDRKVYEGVLSEGEWNTLVGILDSKEFRELNVQQGVPPLVIRDAHTVTVSVAREGKFQNMEFLDNKSRKPYEVQLNPLLKWWKSFRGGPQTESKTPPNASCSLDDTHAVFSQ